VFGDVDVDDDGDEGSPFGSAIAIPGGADKADLDPCRYDKDDELIT